jgi:arylsulfatase A
MIHNWLFTVSVALIATFCQTRDRSANSGNSNPNFILIMADDLGYGDISCYGNSFIHTPNIDGLATEGIRFTNYHSNGAVCSPTRAALMTGKYQQRTGVEGVITAANHRDVGLSLDEITLAEELDKYGYECGIFGKWHLGYASEYNPVHHGFKKFTGYVSGNVDYFSHVDQQGYLDWWRDTVINDEPGYTTDLITRHGVEFIKKNKDKPFFLYLPHEAPHYPYQGRNSKPLRRVGVAKTMGAPEDSITVLYKEMVEVMDEGIGKIIKTLKETGTYENTLIFFCSDNGANKNGNNGILRGFKGGVYEGGHRVPAVAWYPGEIGAGTVCDEPVLSMDILPTFLDFIDKKPSGKNIDGVSFKYVLLNSVEQLPERDLFWSFRNQDAIISGKWKMVVRIVNNDENTELFNLDEDIQEKVNMAEQQPEVVQQLKEKLISWQRETRRGVANLTD